MFDKCEKFVGPTQTLTQKIKSEFFLVGSQEINYHFKWFLIFENLMNFYPWTQEVIMKLEISKEELTFQLTFIQHLAVMFEKVFVDLVKIGLTILENCGTTIIKAIRHRVSNSQKFP